MNADTTTTHCIQCGEPVSLALVIPSLGRCPKCYARFTSGRDPKSQIPTDTLSCWQVFIRVSQKTSLLGKHKSPPMAPYSKLFVGMNTDAEKSHLNLELLS